MTEPEIGFVILTLGIFLGAVHVFGRAASKLHQPRLVGEILAGVLLGPFVLGKVAPQQYEFLFANPTLGADKTKVILGFVYWLGVLLLMFLSGSQVKRLLSQENRRETAWILGIGTPLPFLLVLGLGLASLIPVDPLVGHKGVRSATILVLASAVAVTSIPVISRIFTDLGIMHTRFASLILGSAVLEDIALWGVLAIATALTTNTSLAGPGVIGESTRHILIAIGYMGAALIVAPHALRLLRAWRWNILYRASPLAYSMVVMFAYVGIAAILGVNLVFAAFLSGFGLSGGLAGGERQHYADALDAIYKVSFAVFVPIYFGLVGHRLVFGREFSLTMFVVFLIASSLVALISVGGAAKLAGFRWLDIVNLAITTNARGGPEIVLASVAFDAGIISAAFYTTLVLTAIVTSQIAGMWLRYVLSRGWPLLSTDPEDRAIAPNVPAAPAPVRELRPQTA